jgi:TolB protein
MKYLKKILVLLAALTALGAATPALAALQVDVTQGNAQPLPIAIPDFLPGGGGDPQAGANIAGVVRADLERSGLFRPLDQKGFVEHITNINTVPNFQSWRSITAQGLVTGQVTQQPDGRLRVDFRLWDVFGESQMLGLQFFSTPDAWRRIAHMVSDAIYERVTGEKGYFDTRIVYISATGPRDRRTKRLAIMDQDGASHRFLTNGQSLVLTPRFAPNQQTITYMSYVRKQPRVYVYSIGSGTQRLIVNQPYMTFSPRFSPDSRSIIFSMSVGGNTDLYRVGVGGGTPVRLTTAPGIDTGASYSPDGRQIVFESDRGGTQQLYVMNSDGSNQRRISFGGGRYGTPVWSPRGDLIAFTKIGGGFNIGVIRPDGSGERILSDGWQDEGPSWSPNGRVIIFFRTARGSGRADLFSVDLTGVNTRKIPTPLDGSDPSWSPLLP